MKNRTLPKILALLTVGVFAVSPVQATMVGHWKLDETEGFAAADSKGGNTATNRANAGLSWTNGIIGGAVDLDGVSGANRALYIDSISALDGATEMTMSVWFQLRRAQQGSSYKGVFMGRGVTDNNGGPNQNWGLAWRNGNLIESRISQLVGSQAGTIDASEEGKWYHLALVWKGGVDSTLYVDGQAFGGGANAESVTTWGPIYIGADPCCPGSVGNTVDRVINAAIDDVGIWDEALTADQIQTIYNSGLAGIDAASALATLEESTWVNTGSGNWSEAANWDGGVPNGAGHAAILGPVITEPSTVTLDMHATLDALTFQNANNSYTLADSGSAGLTGLTLQGVSTITVLQGEHTLTAAITAGPTPNVTIAGAGTLMLPGTQNYTAGTTIDKATVSVDTLANGGSPSGIGASDSSAGNLVFKGGTLRYTGAGSTSDRLLTLGVGTATIDASGTGPLVMQDSSGMFLDYGFESGSRVLRLTGSNTDDNTFGLWLLEIYPTSIVKDGPGKWLFGNSLWNSYTGETLINEGTLALTHPLSSSTTGTIKVAEGATLDVTAVPGFTLNSPQVLEGSGTIVGDLATTAAFESTIRPGGQGHAGTLEFADNLNLQDAAIVQIDLAATTADPSDKLTVAGNLSLGGTVTVDLNLLAPPFLEAGTYTIIEYGGTVTGSAANLAVNQSTFYTITPVIDTANKQVNLVVTGEAPTLTWAGDGTQNLWQVGVMNWNNNTEGWIDGAHALFDDTGDNTVQVRAPSAVFPASVEVNASQDYEFGHNLEGGMALTKSGSGELYINGQSRYTGGTTISEGRLRMGRNNAIGSSYTSPYFCVISNGATLDLYGWSLRDNNTGDLPILVEGSGTDGLGAIIDTRDDKPYDLLSTILTGDTTVSNEWRMAWRTWQKEIGIELQLNGHTLTKRGAGALGFFDLDCNTGGTIDILEGIMWSWGSGGGSYGAHFTGGGTINIANGAEFRIGNNGSVFESDWTLNLAGRLWRQSDATYGGPINLLPGYQLDWTTGTLQLAGPVAGTVDLVISAGGNIRLLATNTYTGNTIISAGELQVRENGSMATSPVIDVQSGGTLDVGGVNGGFMLAASQTLMGEGTVQGAFGAEGSIAPGASAGSLTFQGGLDLSAGGTYVWELGALSTANPGTDFDQLALTGGELVLGGASTLDIQFIDNASAPSASEPFWQTEQSWTIIAGSGEATNPSGLAFANVVNGVYEGLGYFTTTADELGNVTLTWMLGEPPLEPPTLEFSIQDGAIQFDWTGTRFMLEAQTNGLDVGLTGDWQPYPGGGTPPVNAPIDPENPTVFFRLISTE